MNTWLRLAALRLIFDNDSGAGSGGGKPDDSKPGEKPKEGESGEKPKEGEGRDWQKEAKDNATESQKLRKRIADFEKAEEDRKNAELSDKEKAEKERDKANGDVAAANKRAEDAEIRAVASHLGFRDPKDALAVIDRSKLDEDLGNVEELLKEVAKTKSYLLKDSDEQGGQGGQGGANNPANGGKGAVTREKAERAAINFPFLGNRVKKQ